MNARRQECLGLYGFGSGYLASLRGEQERQSQGVKIPSLCETCPKRRECFELAVVDHPDDLRDFVRGNYHHGMGDFLADVLELAELPETRLRRVLRVSGRIG